MSLPNDPDEPRWKASEFTAADMDELSDWMMTQRDIDTLKWDVVAEVPDGRSFSKPMFDLMGRQMLMWASSRVLLAWQKLEQPPKRMTVTLIVEVE